MLQPGRVLRWIYLGRMSLATAIFLAAVFQWQRAGARATLLAALALFGTIFFTGATVWYASGRHTVVGAAFNYSQTLFDLALVTVVIDVTGGAQSQFVALYILVTAAAAMVLPGAGGLLVAGLGNALYIGDVMLRAGSGSLPMSVLLQLLVLDVVAVGTWVLGARLRDAGASRQELEAQLVLARLQAEDVLRNIRSGIITVDGRGRLLYANPAAGTLLGFDASVVIGRTLEESIAPVSPDLAEALGRAVTLGERVTRGETQITVHGRSYPIGLTTTVIEDRSSPAAVSATVIFQDISDNKRLDELRMRAERLEAVAELSASLAHEIKNPLASIRSAVEQLARAPRATDDEQTLGALIVRESDRLSRLLSEFLDFARARVARVEHVDLAAITRDAAGVAGAHPECGRVRLEVITPDEPLMVEGDEDLLHRAVFNLTLNALQASPPGEDVRVELKKMRTEDIPAGVPFGRDAVSLHVVDHGAGIPEELRDRVFDPFFTTRKGGSGLGLPIVHRAVEAHRGVVFVESNAMGTQFTILLPRWQPKRHLTPVEPALAVTAA
jgi:two-component system sensor histidine kinase PilS (NtrC family)